MEVEACTFDLSRQPIIGAFILKAPMMTRNNSSWFYGGRSFSSQMSTWKSTSKGRRVLSTVRLSVGGKIGLLSARFQNNWISGGRGSITNDIVLNKCVLEVT